MPRHTEQKNFCNIKKNVFNIFQFYKLNIKLRKSLTSAYIFKENLYSAVDFLQILE